jgi:hypothetical protein
MRHWLSAVQAQSPRHHAKPVAGAHDERTLCAEIGCVNGGPQQQHDSCQAAEHQKIVQAQIRPQPIMG